MSAHPQADGVAAGAIAKLEHVRTVGRSRLVAKGFDPDQVLAKRVEGVREVMHLFTAEPLPAGTVSHPSSSDHDPFDTSRYAPGELAGLVPAIVWELRRESGRWPYHADVIDRLQEWTSWPRSEVVAIALAADSEATTGATLAVPVGRSRSGDEWYWYVADQMEAARQELLWQWRQLLGPDGITYRHPFTLFATSAIDQFFLPA